MNITWRSCLNLATSSATKAWISSAVADRSGLQHDVADGDLAGLVVGQPDDGGVGDRRVGEQHASSSAGATWKPLYLMSSFSRSTT